QAGGAGMTDNSNPQPDIRLTRMKKAGLALLSKHIKLGDDGRPSSPNFARMVDEVVGFARRFFEP
ncbi:MAG TPA: hypothetical protein VHK45_06770, partial [Geminicoccaceae bacterium]|nr:hypothetical protein [Geminicoccaceae bacterium]